MIKLSRIILQPMQYSSKMSTCNSRTIFKRFLSHAIPVEEVKIPMPWGEIAGKWWGPKDRRPILALHGWQDNCGTFDRLIPLLPQEESYLAIDFPGHGLSSQLQQGSFYHFMNSIITVAKIKEYYQWPKLTFIGHSLGAIISYTYSSLYPQNVDYVVCLDALTPLVLKRRIDQTVKSLDDFLKFDIINSSGKEPPSYNLEEMPMILHKASLNQIDVECCKYILERNIRPSKVNPGKYYFSRDLRLKTGTLLAWTAEDCLELTKRVNFPVLLITADQTPYRSIRSVIEPCIDILKEHPDTFEKYELEGTHHVHLNEPEKVAKLVVPFIRKHSKATKNADQIKTKL